MDTMALSGGSAVGPHSPTTFVGGLAIETFTRVSRLRRLYLPGNARRHSRPPCRGPPVPHVVKRRGSPLASGAAVARTVWWIAALCLSTISRLFRADEGPYRARPRGEQPLLRARLGSWTFPS